MTLDTSDGIRTLARKLALEWRSAPGGCPRRPNRHAVEVLRLRLGREPADREWQTFQQAWAEMRAEHGSGVGESPARPRPVGAFVRRFLFGEE